VVTIIHCLEHCHTPALVLTEAHRILKLKGILMVVVPIEENGLSIKGDHCYAMRSEVDVCRMIEKAGLRVERSFVGREGGLPQATVFARRLQCPPLPIPSSFRRTTKPACSQAL